MAGLLNPQLGGFVDAFPCGFLAVGNPPLALVRFLEKDGWRSSAGSILRSHLNQAIEMVDHLSRAVTERRLSGATFTRIGRVFTIMPIVLMFDLFRGSWGAWTEGFLDRIRLVFSVCSECFRLAVEFSLFGFFEFFFLLCKKALNFIAWKILPVSFYSALRRVLGVVKSAKTLDREQKLS